MIRGSVSHGVAQGLRPTQEDRAAVVRLELPSLDGWLLGVMDGHGGADTAHLCADRIEPAFLDAYEASDGAVEPALRELVRRLDEATRDLDPGSSLTVACIAEDTERAFFAVVGDSPVLFRDADDRIRLGPVHNVGVDDDGLRRALDHGALHRGGYLVDPASGSGVALTRALGDRPLTFLDRTPDLLETDLHRHSFVLLASDGLYAWPDVDVARQAELLAERVDEGVDADGLCTEIGATATDNVTAVLWKAF